MNDWADITTLQDEFPRRVNVHTGEVQVCHAVDAIAHGQKVRLPGYEMTPRRLSCVSCGAPANSDRCGYCGTANAQP